MIINIRGTSGTGKSTAVRSIISDYVAREDFFKPGRKQPLYSVLQPPRGRTVAILGHYNAACGGCDTINSYEEIYDLVRKMHDDGHHVLYEGLLISGESARPIQLLKDGYPLRVFAIKLPIEVCIASVNARRWAKDPSKPGVNPKNTIAKARAVELAMEKMAAAGVSTAWLTRAELPDRVRELLNES